MAPVGDRAAKRALFDALADVAGALASGRRAEIVDVLAQGERPVDEIASEIDQSVANTSHHLRTLARAGLTVSRRAGTRIYYRLASDHVADLWRAVRDVATEHGAGLDRLAEQYLGDRDDVDRISRDELSKMLRRGNVVVLDVRPAAEFAAGHIPGARSVPPDDVRRNLRAVDGGRDVVAYCRGPFCVYADDAVRLLRRRGIPARRLEDGFPEWRRAGLPVAVGEGG